MTALDVNNPIVIHNVEGERFEIQLGDDVAILEYQRSGDNIIFPHTEVPTKYEGHGLASKLAVAALEYAKQEGFKVVALCPFVSSYIRRHPEYQDITTRSDHKQQE